MKTDKRTLIMDHHWDPHGIITSSSSARVEYALWQDHCREIGFSGNELNSLDFQDYIEWLGEQQHAENL